MVMSLKRSTCAGMQKKKLVTCCVCSGEAKVSCDVCDGGCKLMLSAHYDTFRRAHQAVRQE